MVYTTFYGCHLVQCLSKYVFFFPDKSSTPKATLLTWLAVVRAHLIIRVSVVVSRLPSPCKWYLWGLVMTYKWKEKKPGRGTGTTLSRGIRGLAGHSLNPFFFTLAAVHSNSNVSFGHGLNATLETTKDIFWLSLVNGNSNVGIISILWRVPAWKEMSTSG